MLSYSYDLLIEPIYLLEWVADISLEGELCKSLAPTLGIYLNALTNKLALLAKPL
jgi:hypothetical protein